MRIGLKRVALVAALAFAVVPAAALAGGGPGRAICTGGNCTIIQNFTNFTLDSTIGPVSPWEALGMRGTARYEVKDGHRSLVVGVRGLDPLDGQQLEVLVGNVVQTEVVVSATGTLDWSVDTARGDSVPDVGVGTAIVFTHPNFLMVGAGEFH